MYFNNKTPAHTSTLVLLAGLGALVMNIYLPSLPGMSLYFDVDYGMVQLSVALYLMASAVVQLFIGPISDKIGRRPVLLWGICLFLISTLGCILAPNIYVFLGFRIAQATVATTMALSRAIIRDIVSDDVAASRIGYVTMGMSVVPMVSPAIGGTLEELWGWQSTFWFMFLCGAVALTVVYFDAGETKKRSGNTLWRQFKEYPELLTSPRFWGYSLAAAFCSGSFFAYLGGAPYVATQYFDLSPAVLGYYFGAPALGYFLGNYLSGAYSIIVGMNRMVLWGTWINLLGVLAALVLFYLGLGNVVTFFAFMTFIGLGNGMTIPNATAGALSVRPHLAGTASGLAASLMIAGGAALSALAGVLLETFSGAFPLLWLMSGTSALGLAAAYFTILRDRRLSA